ncbi:MAG: hypothetical protein P8M78_14155 [Myxococcota bacterium]|nr:hypothetical protein [Myxococcota bacterium]
MISMQYARNLASGQGLVWNAGGAPVQGISNPAVTLVMAVLHWLPVSPGTVSLLFQILNLGILLATLIATFLLALTLLPERKTVAYAALLATMLSGPLALWALRGSDMGFVTLWLLVGAQGIAQVEFAGRESLSLRLVALAPGLLIRPDVALFYFLILGAAFMLGHRRAALAGALAGGLVLGIWLGVAWLYYGDPLPNTYYLKATGHPRLLVLAKGVELVGRWAPALCVPFLLTLATAWRHRRQTTYQLLAAIPVTSVIYSIWVGGDWMSGHGVRFMVPMIPVLSILMMEEVDLWMGRVVFSTLRSDRVRAAATLTLAIALGVLGNPPAARAEWLTGAPPQLLDYNRNNYFFARYLKRYTDPSTTVGVYWAGVPVYFSQRRGIDFLGKSDSHIARLEVDRFKPGHSKWDWDYVLLELRPDIMMDDSLGLADHPIFQRDYFRVEKGKRFFFIRRDALNRLNDPSITLIDLATGRTLGPPDVLGSDG